MIFDRPGFCWFKGNLHTHTTRSDGRKTPEQAIACYKEHGYDFLALTDHWRWSGAEEAGGMTVLSGIEYDVGSAPVSGIFHLVAIGAAHDPGLTRERGPGAQQIIDAVHKAGGLAILAHPAWSLNTPEQIRRLKRLDALEIYNSVSGLPHNARPDASLIVDQLACAGWTVPCLASDDSHFYDGEETTSFTWVQSKSRAPDDLLEAIRQGRLYASQGPRLSFWREDGHLEIRCTPARAIVVYSDAVWSAHRVLTGTGLTEGRYELNANDHVVRIEIIDELNRRAWTSPYPVQSLVCKEASR